MCFFKKILFFLVTMSVMNCFGQTIYGKIEYKIQSIDFSTKSNDTKIKNVMGDLLAEANKQMFSIEFNSSRSRFTINTFLSTPSNNEQCKKTIVKIASNRFTSDFNYYLDKKENVVILEKTNGALIKKKYDKKVWDITSESKMVDKYLCYKANHIKSYIGRDGKEKNITIIAWFAPSLPFAYGPKDYNGLPGLILELTEKETTYYASKINITKDKEVKIDFPKGKTISEEEYNRMVMPK